MPPGPVSVELCTLDVHNSTKIDPPLARVEERQTRSPQKGLLERACGFESRLGHRPPYAAPMARRRRRARRRLLLVGLLAGVAVFRKRRLDAADEAFPSATSGGPG